MTALGDFVRARRDKLGWSLRRAEEETGIANAHLSQIETGKIERPSQGVLYQIATAYDLSYTKLLTLAGHARTTTLRRQGVLLRATEGLDQDEVLAALEELRRKRDESET